MNKLSYKTLEEIKYNGYLLKDDKERMLQFGEGNFLRAFVDYFVDVMNEKADFNCKVAICQPIANGLSDVINEQEGLYTLYFRGFENGEKINSKRVISSVSRCVNPYKDFDSLMDIAKNPDLRFISCNTTEAGIAYDPTCKLSDKPASSFPAKLTQFLYERFKNFGGDINKGFIILSCELIDDNGKELEKCVLKYVEQWNLGDDFKQWVISANQFCSTLVDRIVTGYPKDEASALNQENGYQDNLLDTAEVFGLWVIEGSDSIKDELPFEKAGLPIIVTDNHKPYKQRKVSILNGAHTSMVLGAYLSGQNIVRDCMNDDVIQSFLRKTIFDEIIPTLDLDKDEIVDFANSVIDRFLNPFIDHQLLAISLNSTSKWKARVMPSLIKYMERFDKIPECITASFAFYISFYRGFELKNNVLIGMRNGEEYNIIDDLDILEFYNENKDLSSCDLVSKVCANTSFWDMDLRSIKGFEDSVNKYMSLIEEKGCYEVMKALCD